MKLLVHALGAWVTLEAASGRYPRPLAIGLTMLVSRLGAPTAALALAGFALKRLDEAGAFDGLRTPPPRRNRARPAPRLNRNTGKGTGTGTAESDAKA